MQGGIKEPMRAHGTPTVDQPIRIGARGSPLSLAQTGWLQHHLGSRLGLDEALLGRLLPITPITTTGDRIQDRSLQEAGGKGLFTKELDEALLDGRIDCAIHSLKDVPTVLPDGIVLLPSPIREDPRDALVTAASWTVDELPHGARVGTASLRRHTQMLYARPDLQIAMLRGNVGTRLARVNDGAFHATLLAVSGLKRLGKLDSLPHQKIDPVQMPPAIGQGALAITCRSDDTRVMEAWAAIADEPTNLALAAERAFLKALDGSCRTSIGGHAWLDQDNALQFIGEALTEDGSARFRRTGQLDNPTMVAATAMAEAMAAEIKAEAGQRLPIGSR